MPLHRRHLLAGTAAVGGLLAAAPESVAAPASATRPEHGLVGEDVIKFGPGNGSGPRQPATVDAGERYSWMGGSLGVSGVRVLITGRAPFNYRLTLR